MKYFSCSSSSFVPDGPRVLRQTTTGGQRETNITEKWYDRGDTDEKYRRGVTEEAKECWYWGGGQQTDESTHAGSRKIAGIGQHKDG